MRLHGSLKPFPSSHNEEDENVILDIWKRFIIDENIISSIQKEKKDTLDYASSTLFFFSLKKMLKGNQLPTPRPHRF
jgi:hypothetical protein